MTLVGRGKNRKSLRRRKWTIRCDGENCNVSIANFVMGFNDDWNKKRLGKGGWFIAKFPQEQTFCPACVKKGCHKNPDLILYRFGCGERLLCELKIEYPGKYEGVTCEINKGHEIGG